MKKFLNLALVATAILIVAASSCASEKTYNSDRLMMAEEAIDAGRNTSAQKMADDLMADSAAMSVDDLCRLSVLFMRLSDVGTEQEANTAYAARALALAYQRDPDSTRAVIARSPIDVRAAMTLLSAINEAPHGIVIDGDTIYFPSDTIPEDDDQHYEH
ncbi:MAG: hypothetical protein K2K69_00875 [Muribaculaceae bacterium]|nr:hypothetical protein [Muribaculaceae bacterium]